MSLAETVAFLQRAQAATNNLQRVVRSPLSPKEARTIKKTITDLQRQLRYQKRLVNAEKRQVAQEFATQAAQVGRGVGSALFGGLFGRRAAGRLNAANRSAVRDQRLNRLAPYNELVQRIDGVIHGLDRMKFTVDSSAQNR